MNKYFLKYNGISLVLEYGADQDSCWVEKVFLEDEETVDILPLLCESTLQELNQKLDEGLLQIQKDDEGD